LTPRCGGRRPRTTRPRTCSRRDLLACLLARLAASTADCRAAALGRSTLDQSGLPGQARHMLGLHVRPRACVHHQSILCIGCFSSMLWIDATFLRPLVVLRSRLSNKFWVLTLVSRAPWSTSTGYGKGGSAPQIIAGTVWRSWFVLALPPVRWFVACLWQLWGISAI
jgi:hypothetical protein